MSPPPASLSIFFFFNDTATTEIYTLSLHDALPIFGELEEHRAPGGVDFVVGNKISSESQIAPQVPVSPQHRSEEHTSELQSQSNLVCRLLLEKKKKNNRSLTGSLPQTPWSAHRWNE